MAGAEERYEYEDTVEWSAGRRGRVGFGGVAPLTVGPPPEFDGEAGMWNPEQLLLASAASCLLTTFVAVARKMRLDFVSYESRATAQLTRGPDGKFAITGIQHFPRIGVRAPGDVDRANRAVEKAEAHCLISNSLKYPTEVRAVVHVAGPSKSASFLP